MKFISHHRSTLIFAVILASLLIRFWKMEYVPFQSDGDELAHVFLGQSLLQQGKPISWSSFAPGNRDIWDQVTIGDADLNADDTFTLLTPWYDHPPLLGFLAGLVTTAFRYDFPSIPPSLLIRSITLILAAITLLLIYFTTKELFGANSALAALSIYGLSPAISIGNRLLVGENLFIPLMLASLLLLQQKRSLFWPIILNSLAVFAKYTGLFAIPFTALYLICAKRYKAAASLAVGSIIFTIIIFGIYTNLHGFDIFQDTVSTQSGRLIGWSNPAFILSHPGFQNKTMLDFSYYFILIIGFAGIFIQTKKDGPHSTFIALSIFGALLLVWLSSAEQDMLGWYKLPLFTFLSMSAGRVVSNSKNWLWLTIFLGILVCSNSGLIKFPERLLPSPLHLRAAVGLLVIAPMIFVLVKNQLSAKFRAGLLTLYLIIYFAQSLYIVHNYYRVLCKDRLCPIPQWQLNQIITGQLRR